MSLRADLEALADSTDFSGALAVSRAGEPIVELARGYADRANGRPNALDTRFATASATKGLTALTVASLIESGELRGDTTLRSLYPGRPADGRPGGHDRALAWAHIGRRRLPGRGRARGRRRLRHGPASPPTRRARRLSAAPRRARAEDAARRAVCVQQRRLRDALDRRGDCDRTELLRPGPGTGARSGGHGRHGLRAIRSAPGGCGTRLSGGRADERPASAGARRRRRRRVLDGPRPRGTVGSTLRRPDPADAGRRRVG